MKLAICLFALALAGCAGQKAEQAAIDACKHLEGTPDYGSCYATVYATDLQQRRAAASALGSSMTSAGAGMLAAPTYRTPMTTNCQRFYNGTVHCTTF